ncbi:MAG: response regulator [Bdellovibrionales bacterium]|nr:response regulator [Bdellovibrionales bacterium]
MPLPEIPENEHERLQALRSYEILDSERDDRFDDIVMLARQAADTPVAFVSLLDANRQWFKSCNGLDVDQTPREVAFCAHAILSPEPFVVEDASVDPRVRDNPRVTGEPGIRFYTGIPLLDSKGFALGTLCVLDFVPRKISEEVLSTLKILARQVVSLIELHRALSQEHRYLTESEEARREAQRANKAKTTFLANMSHEIRTPITSIMGLAEILTSEEDFSPFDSAQASQMILSSARYLLEIINNLLDLSKIDSGKFGLEIRECSIFEIIRDVEAIVDLKAIEKKLLFLIDFEYPLPKTVETDNVRLKQVLVNLCNNALKFTENGTVKLSVACQPDEELLTITVEDTGIGMTPEETSKLFQPFQQANKTITRRFGGTGLGLSISKSIVEQLGGRIELSSTKDVGTTFQIFLPTGELSHIELLNENPLLPHLEDDIDSKRYHGRVLVVEDEPLNLKLIRHILEKVGLQVTSSSDGNDAVSCAVNGDFDLILMDMHLPSLDGISATKAIRQRGVFSPIVALTASQDRSEIESFFEAGCEEYVPKPFERSQLYQCIQKYFEFEKVETSEDGAAQRSALPNNEQYAELVLSYLKKLHSRLSAIEEAFTFEDWETLRERAHSLGGAGLFGFPKISLLARLLEEQSVRRDGRTCRETIRRLQREIKGTSGQKSAEV